MITESLVRITGEAGLRNWPMVKEASVSPSGVMTSRELALLFPENSFNGNKKNHVPNRSGSAPPSIEESCAMWNNDAGQRHPSPFGNIVRTSMDKGYDSEEQIRSQPSYAAFYSSNVNLNPRLPPPITSRETRHLAHHTNNSVEIRKSTYTDESAGSRFSHLTSLPTHTEDSDNVQALDHDSSGNAERLLSGQFVSSLEGRHTSVVDLIQEDFPRTPSPLYSNPVSSHRASGDRANDACASTSQQKDSDAKRKLLKLGSRTCVGSPAGHSGKSIRSNGSTERQLFTRSHSQSASQKEVPGMNGNSVPTSLTDANRDTLSTALQGLHISSKNEVEYSRQNPQPSNLFPQDLTSQVPVLQYHGVGSTFNIGNQFIQGQTKLPVDAQKSVLQNTVTATPFVSAAGFLPSGSPIYSNMPSMLSPHYNIGGYTANISPFLPSFAGYPPSGAHPMTFESYPAVGINAANGNTASGLDLQYPYKYYGQMGVVLQPSLSDPLYVPYFQHPAVGAYGAPVQYELTNRVHDIQKGPPAYLHDQRQMHVSGGSLSPIKIGIPSTTQYTNLPNVGVIVQYPASPLASPKPLVQPALPVRRFENSKLHACPIKNAGTYSGWQVPKDIDVNGENKSYLILEELKSNKCHRFELSDVVGHVVELSTDQHGSRFIQQKLEFCCDAEKASVFSEVLPRSAMLMTDVFGNYVIQKFFEYGSTEQRKELANQLVGRVLPLSLQMYGCRVIQKALEVVEVDQKTELVLELNGHVMRCVRDQNGNHVIQKCIECVPTDRILFIISSFHGQIASLSMHPYGCRVIQRVLEHCTDEAQIQCIVNEILQSAGLLAQDQYGNYVIQHVLERGKPHERNQIISKLSGQVVQMSQHKFASNVIEKCLQYGDAAEREDIIEEIVGETEGNDVLLMMMKDQFANYVVQKILDTCNDKQQEILLSRIRANLQVLKRYTYGKHIVARVEQLSGESHVASE